MATKTTTVALLTALALTGLGGCDTQPETAVPKTGNANGCGELGITLPDLDDEDISIASADANELHLLAFWAIWCVPCTAELAKMKGMYERLHPRGLNIYAISIDGPDTMSRVPGFAAQEGYEYPVLYDSDTAVMGRYNPKGDIPFYVILDGSGNIVKTHQGYVKGDVIELEKFLTARLDSPGDPRCDAAE